MTENHAKSEQNCRRHAVSYWKARWIDFFIILGSILDPKLIKNRSNIDAECDEQLKMAERGLKEALGTHLEPS